MLGSPVRSSQNSHLGLQAHFRGEVSLFVVVKILLLAEFGSKYRLRQNQVAGDSVPEPGFLIY
jgi:hypothetical protein